MKTYSKSLMVAIAALAVTTTTAQAQGVYLKNLDLSIAQRAALVEAGALRKVGDVTAARNVLLEAGFDETTLEQMRNSRAVASKSIYSSYRWQDIKGQLSDEQLIALQVAKQANDRETVAAILDEAGIQRPVRASVAPVLSGPEM